MQADKLNSGRKRQSVCLCVEREREGQNKNLWRSSQLTTSGWRDNWEVEERRKVNCKMCIFTQLKKTRARVRASACECVRACMCVCVRERERCVWLNGERDLLHKKMSLSRPKISIRYPGSLAKSVFLTQKVFRWKR